MANAENAGAAGTPKNTSRGGAGSKAGRGAADAGARSFEADAGQTAEIAQAAEAVTDKAAETSRAAANANTEMVQAHLATSQESIRSGLDAWARMFEGMTQSWTRALGVPAPKPEPADQAARNVRAASEASSALTDRAQDAWRAWFELTQRSVRTNLEAMSQLANCRSMPEAIKIQSNLLSSNLQQAIESSQIIARASSDALGQAGGAMQAQPRAAATLDRASRAS